MSPRVFSFLTIIAFGVNGAALAADRQLAGRVLRVIDGDSLVLDVRGSQYRVELTDIDAPELNQPWGVAAADRLQHSLTGRFVVVYWSGTVDDGRIEGRLTSKNRDIALDLLYEGLAWCTLGVVTEFPDQGRPYRDAEAVAREAHRGLWSDERSIPPWEWREQRLRPFD